LLGKVGFIGYRVGVFVDLGLGEAVKLKLVGVNVGRGGGICGVKATEEDGSQIGGEAFGHVGEDSEGRGGAIRDFHEEIRGD